MSPIPTATPQPPQTIAYENIILDKTLTGHSERICFEDCLAFSPNGQYLASGSYDKTIKIWEVETGREIRTLNGHSEYVNSVAFSPNGKYLASSSDDKTIKIW